MPDLYVAKEEKPTTSKVEKAENVDSKNQTKEVEKEEFKSSHNPLSAFCYRPAKTRFETQEREEQVVLLLRRHPITNLNWILLTALLVLASMFFNYLPFFSNLPANYQLATYVLWYFLAAAITIEGALTWFFNVNIITDERLVDVDFYTLIYREISDTQINKIQEVTHTMGGLFSIFFNYGNVHIQTAGAIPNFEFSQIPRPAHVVKILQELQREEEQEQIEGRIR
jgi:hypothetical protein